MENDIKTRLAAEMGTLAVEIGQRIKELRVARGLLQSALADQLGLTRAAITNWENGQATCNYAQALELERILETDVSYILYGRDAPNRSRDENALAEEFSRIAASSDAGLHDLSIREPH